MYMNALNKKAWMGILKLILGLGLSVFLPAWTFQYWQAWAFIAVMGGGSILVTLWLMKYDRKLLERRVSAGPGAEKNRTQKLIMALSLLTFIALLVVSALDHRFGWSPVPTLGVLLGLLLIALGYYVIWKVFKENSFTAATVEIQQDQKVISTGPYAYVRHPMYFGGILFLLGPALALGSYWGLLLFVPFVPILMWRLLDEEKMLAKDLPGYTDYQKKVKQRLIPFVW